MTVLTPPGFLQGGTYTAKLDRIYLATIGSVPNLAASFSARQGFYGGRVPVFANPSGMNVTIGACAGLIANTFASASGDYLFANDATVQVTPAASSPTQNRHDIIGFQVKDNLFDSSGLNTVVPAIIQGANSAGTPSDPTLPASFIPVVRAVVNAGVTSPTLQSLIRKTTSEGGIMRIADVAERAEITGHDGMPIYREDRDWIEVFDGAVWRVQGVAVCTSTTDRDNAITNPYSGQLAVTTDTDQLWHYDAATTQWRYATPGTVVGGKRRTTTASPTSGATELQVLDTGALPLIGNSQWEVVVGYNWDSNVAGDHFIPRVRQDNSGGAVMQQQTVPGVNVTGVPTGWRMSIPFLTSTPLTKTFVATIARLAGSGTATVTGGSFMEVIYKGSSTMYGTL